MLAGIAIGASIGLVVAVAAVLFYLKRGGAASRFQRMGDGGDVRMGNINPVRSE